MARPKIDLFSGSLRAVRRSGAACEGPGAGALFSTIDAALPPGTTISIDGVDRGERRHFELKTPADGRLTAFNLLARFPDGKTAERQVLLKQGWHLRVSLSPAVRPPPELVVPMGHSRGEEHTKGVTSVAFSPDGRHVLSGSVNRSAILWDCASGRELRVFRERGAHVFSVAFSPDGRHVLIE